jgi:hypothetical protein
MMWGDGIFCFVSNVVIGPMAEAPREKVQLIWRLVTQPLSWALMAFITAWLFQAVVAIWQNRRLAT